MSSVLTSTRSSILVVAEVNRLLSSQHLPILNNSLQETSTRQRSSGGEVIENELL